MTKKHTVKQLIELAKQKIAKPTRCLAQAHQKHFLECDLKYKDYNQLEQDLGII